MAAAGDVDGFEFAAFDTVQHSLARDAEEAHGFVHGHEVLAGIIAEAGTHVIRQSDAPRRAGRHLFAGNDAIIEQAMQS